MSFIITVTISLAVAFFLMALHLMIDHDYGRKNSYIPIMLSIGALVLMLASYFGSTL